MFFSCLVSDVKSVRCKYCGQRAVVQEGLMGFAPKLFRFIEHAWEPAGKNILRFPHSPYAKTSGLIPDNDLFEWLNPIISDYEQLLPHYSVPHQSSSCSCTLKVLCFRIIHVQRHQMNKASAKRATHMEHHFKSIHVWWATSTFFCIFSYTRCRESFRL